MLLDNNLLAAENATEILERVVARDYRVIFSQSLDIFRLTHKNVELLQRVKSVNSRFSKPMICFSCNSLPQRDLFMQSRTC